MKTRLFQAIEIAKDSIPLKTACEYYGLEFNRAGFCRCPFHNEKTASFTIHRNQGHCFGCGWDGDLIDFVQKMCGCTDKMDALRLISKDFMLPLGLDEKPKLSDYHAMSMRHQAIQNERREQAEAEQKALDEYHAAHSWYALLDRWSREFNPTDPNEPLDPRYVEAMKWIDFYKYKSEQQEVNLCLLTKA